MASATSYATSLRHDRAREDKAAEPGVPFFVPQLAKVKTNVMCQAKKSQHLLFSFEKDEVAAAGGAASPVAVPYRKQGDQELYSDDNMRKRRQLLYDRQVLGAIARFWETFPVVRQGAAQIEQHDYVDVFVKLYKALVAPSEFSVAEAKRIVEKDWSKDVGSDPSVVMAKDMFSRALFEVADIWTVGIGSDEYSSFLTKLFKRVTMTVYDHERSRWVTVFQELDHIRSFATVDPRDEASNTAAAEFVDVVTTAVAASASKPPRPPLLKRKSQKTDDAASAAIDSHVSNDQRPTSMLADAKQQRRRQDSILPLSFSPDRAKSSTPAIAPLPLSGARSPFQRFGHGDKSASDDNFSNSGGVSETPLTTRRDVPYRTGRRNQPGPMAEDRGNSVGSDDDNDDDDVSDDSDVDQDGNNDGDRSSVAEAQSSRSITGRRLRRTASIKSESSSVNQSRRKPSGAVTKGPTPTSPTRQMLPELPTQHIHLTMPNIYLSPDLTQSQATERAARRRVRKSTKLAQRMRRITF